MFKNTANQYSWITKLLHWAVAALVLMQFFYILKRNSLPEGDPLRGDWMFLHKSFGFTIFWLAIIFVLWAFANRKPDWPGTMASWQKCLARLTHILLYTLIILMPLTGLLMGLTNDKPVNVFNLFIIPGNFLPQSELISGFTHTIHVLTPWLLGGLIMLHTLGALVHQYYYKDDVLKRML